MPWGSRPTEQPFQMSGYDTPEQYLKWAWSNKLGPAPPMVQALKQQPGMTGGNPFTMEGGYTPDFSMAVNQMMFPNVRPGLRGMGGYGTNEAPSAGAGVQGSSNQLLEQLQEMFRMNAQYGESVDPKQAQGIQQQLPNDPEVQRLIQMFGLSGVR